MATTKVSKSHVSGGWLHVSVCFTEPWFKLQRAARQQGAAGSVDRPARAYRHGMAPLRYMVAKTVRAPPLAGAANWRAGKT